MSKTEEQARDFYKSDDCENNKDYDFGNSDEWYFSKQDMILFATRFVKSQHEQQLQAEKKRVEELKSFTNKLDQEFKEGKVKLSKPLLDFAKSRKILNNE